MENINPNENDISQNKTDIQIYQKSEQNNSTMNYNNMSNNPSSDDVKKNGYYWDNNSCNCSYGSPYYSYSKKQKE